MKRGLLILGLLFGLGAGAAFAEAEGPPERSIAPQKRPVAAVVARWDAHPRAAIWTQAALTALRTHGAGLVDAVPADVRGWCPAYPEAGKPDRRAFWTGYLSLLSRYESTHRPAAVGGDGRWFGLLQISPATARGYGCAVGTGEALKDGPANLSCAVRIMARTVTRDGVIHGRDSKWRGISADWGPMRDAAKREAMAKWLRAQEYCKR